MAAREERRRAEEHRRLHAEAVRALCDELLRAAITAGSARTPDELRGRVQELEFAHRKAAETWHEDAEHGALAAASVAVRGFRELVDLWEVEAQAYRRAVSPALRVRGSDAELAEIKRELEWGGRQLGAAIRRAEMHQAVLKQSEDARAALTRWLKEKAA